MKDEFSRGFEQALLILRDYLPHMVFGGGYALMVYYRYVLGDREREPLRTGDIDILVEGRVPAKGRKPIDQILTSAGLSRSLRGRGGIPAVSYQGTVEGVEIEIEFLTDQKGPKEEEIIRVQEDLNAQALRYIGVSLENNMEVVLDDIYFEGTSEPVRIRVPKPAAFIFNKGLVFTRRNDRLKKAKDLYYIFDVLTSLEVLRDGIYRDMGGFRETYSPWFKRFTANLGKYFEDPASEGVRLVVDQRPPTAFLELTPDQFGRYVFGVFRDFTQRIQRDE